MNELKDFKIFWILIGKEPKSVDLIEYKEWFETADRHVKDEVVNDIRISTVFLGIDRRFGDGPPILFETMVFGGPLNKEMERYSTWDEAEKGHDRMVQRVKDEIRKGKK